MKKQKKENKKLAEIWRESGKWLMDVSKYVMTAVIVTTCFKGMPDRATLVIGIIVTSILFFVGILLFVKGKEEIK